MRYAYIEPFVNTALRILNASIPETAKRGEVTAVPADQIRAEVSISVRIAGESDGDVVISMDTAAALAICSMLLGGKIDSLTAGALDALAELGNMIAGNAISELNDLGFDFTMSTPVVTAGGSPGLSGQEAVQIPLESKCGTMSIHVLLGAD